MRKIFVFIAIFFGAAAIFLGAGQILAAVSPVSATSTPVLLIVPFTSQAPLVEWSNPRFQDACEETSVLMAMKWVKGQAIGKDAASKQKIHNEILAISYYEDKIHLTYHDTSASTTAKYLIGGYYKYDNYTVQKNATIKSLIAALEQGSVIIAPTNGRLLHNPNFTGLGPEHHMLLIKGYDYQKKLFITNDPGTHNGENYKYPENVLFNAIADYPTGRHLPRKTVGKTVIIIKK